MRKRYDASGLHEQPLLARFPSQLAINLQRRPRHRFRAEPLEHRAPPGFAQRPRPRRVQQQLFDRLRQRLRRRPPRTAPRRPSPQSIPGTPPPAVARPARPPPAPQSHTGQRPRHNAPGTENTESERRNSSLPARSRLGWNSTSPSRPLASQSLAQRIHERLVRRPATAAHAQLEVPHATPLPQKEVGFDQRVQPLLPAHPRKEPQRRNALALRHSAFCLLPSAFASRLVP